MKSKVLLLTIVLTTLGLRAHADVTINETNFPDENFRSYVLSTVDTDKDGKLSNEEIAKVTEIKVGDKNISDLKGIEYFTALTLLGCSSNQLSALDISKNTALTYLFCSDNQLTTLDVSKNTALMSFECYDCQLTTLDVTKNTALRYLYCSYNQLTTLDVTKNTALRYLECYNNQLTTLDISKNVKLTSLDCRNNKLDTSAIESIVNNLPTTEYGGLYTVGVPEEETNALITKEQVAKAKAKGWTTYYYNGSDWVEYEGTTGIGKVVIGDIECDDNTPIYNTKGQRVGKNYKGVIIYKGKKILKKK